MRDIPKSNSDFTTRLIKLDEELLINNEENTIVQENKNRIESDLVNHNDTWIRNWLTEVKNDLNIKINSEDPDYLGHCIVECEALLQYLDK